MQGWSERSVGVPKIVVEEVVGPSKDDAYLLRRNDNKKEKNDWKRASRSLSIMKLPISESRSKRDGEKNRLEICIKGHQLTEQSFKKATFCDICQRLLVEQSGRKLLDETIQREGLRCKVCKISLHKTCTTNLEECQGCPLGSFSFNRQLSSPTTPEANCFSTEEKKDVVYEVLRIGSDLACKNKSKGTLGGSQSEETPSNSHLGSGSSPTLVEDQPISSQDSWSALERNSNSSEERMSPGRKDARPSESNPKRKWFKIRIPSNSNRQSSEGSEGDDGEAMTRGQLKAQQQIVRYFPMENVFHIYSPMGKLERLAEKRDLYVTLYKYEARHQDDLSFTPGCRIQVIDDKDDSWWTAKLDNKTGFVPANHVMALRPNEDIFICIQSTKSQDSKNSEVQIKKHQIVLVNHERLSDSQSVYSRWAGGEGYIRKEDLKPV